jgi:hypothetical protein
MMGPINVLRGTRAAADFFDAAVEEFEGLVAQGVGPLSEERFRTVVEGPPPYPYYKSFRNLFTRWGPVAVQSTYSTVGGIWEWGFRHDPRRPLESIAQQMLRENLTNRSIVARYGQIRRYIDEWQADGLVIHSIKSCRLFSAGQGDMRDYFIRELGVPTLLVESDLDEIGPRALEATNPVRLTSVCTVFVESDIMYYLAQRKTVEDILGGVHKAIATRTMSLIRRVGVEDEVTFTGGVSRNLGMVRALESVLARPVNVSDEGHFMGALGAALFALERAETQALQEI